MGDGRRELVAFLGVPADPRLVDEPPPGERKLEPVVPSERHDRLVALGSILTGTTLVGGIALLLYGGASLLLDGGGAFALAVALIGGLLAGTHWGWVHVAEYIGVTIDDRHARSAEERRREWLAGIEPYPRLSVTTSVLDDASTRVVRTRHRPVQTARETFIFERETDAMETFPADAPAADIAAAVETMRREARLETDRLRERWEAASTAYAAALLIRDDDEQQLAARRAAATALSEHINKSLQEPPLVE